MRTVTNGSLIILCFLALMAWATPSTGSCVNCLFDPLSLLWDCHSEEGGGAARCTVTGGGQSCSTEGDCGSGCLLAGSMVATPSGSVPIETLKPGDVVLSRGFDGTATQTCVRNVFRTTSPGYLLVNGRLRVTKAHPFQLCDTWRDAGTLKVGDMVEGRTSLVPIASVEFINHGVRVYNLDVGGSHTFFVDGFLVHNKDGFEQHP